MLPKSTGGFLSQEKRPYGGKITSMPKLPRPLDLEEKKYMLSVEKGDIAATKRCSILLNSLESQANWSAECQLQRPVGENRSWEKVERNIASYTPDITPLILAAHKNNYEILKLLIDRGATIPMPHDIRCGCDECVESSSSDSLRHSMARINAYRALASPSLIALSSTDPILTAFELSWELKTLAYTEHEFKAEYMDLKRQCMSFAESLLNQTRSSQELAIILNYDPHTDVPYQDGDHMKLARLELAIDYKQKKFVAHPHIQQLLASLWYDGLPGFRRKTPLMKALEIVKVAVLFPYYCALYMIAPGSSSGKLMKKPFMKFLIHSSSYLFFLFLLILMSQRVEEKLLELVLGYQDHGGIKQQRGLGPTIVEAAVLLYIFGFLWEEIKELWSEGLVQYLDDLWNVVDVSRNVLYVTTVILRVFAYIEQTREIKLNPAVAFLPREMWDPYDAQLIAEGLCAAANVLSALKLVHMFSINPYLGPLQVSLGRMVIDIIKFILIYTLVLFAFACGLNQLLWYYADLERQVCFSLPDGLPDWVGQSSACMNWRRFANLFEATQSMFWATFGLWGLEAFQLKGIQSYTRFWAMLMFGCYSIINVVVLLNLLIAMMSHSFTVITEKADSEWKFARTELWLKYFEPGSTLPPPFNLIPSPKTILRLLKGRSTNPKDPRSIKKKANESKERDYRHMAVMRALVWRYIIQQQRSAEEREVTEDDISEVKNDISSFRCDMLEVFKSNGFAVDDIMKKESYSVCRKSRIWERRLLKDFHVSPIAGSGDRILGAADKTEEPKEKFRRVARMVIGKQQAVFSKWALVVRQAQKMSHIGCTPRSALPHRQSLKKAMEEAAKLMYIKSDSPLVGRSPILINSAAEGRRLLDLLKSPLAERAAALSKEKHHSDNFLEVPPRPGIFRVVTNEDSSGAATPVPDAAESDYESRKPEPSPILSLAKAVMKLQDAEDAMHEVLEVPVDLPPPLPLCDPPPSLPLFEPPSSELEPPVEEAHADVESGDETDLVPDCRAEDEETPKPDVTLMEPLKPEPKNLRKPSTSSLEQVIVGTDHQDLRLDFSKDTKKTESSECLIPPSPPEIVEEPEPSPRSSPFQKGAGWI
ncbi:unnamed protein product [Notodromas monacha]|uniref:Transient receptor ion channel domain-containing protein n=1 Tax=Notodromas monacha TaxID=399045 RepID=A0A7R9BQG2_9CRUS|nr:unnamed protein product [Notodromas monacha]CAG0918283.1 unnamed protein product [Notodromas monacha]